MARSGGVRGGDGFFAAGWVGAGSLRPGRRPAGENGADQAVPGRKEVIGGDGTDVFEQSSPGSEPFPSFLPEFLAEVAGVVHGKCQ